MTQRLFIFIQTTASVVVFLFAPYCLAGSAIQDSALQIVPEVYRAKIQSTFESAGSNGDSLASAVLELQSDEEIEAVAF